mgnify:CR=1 FL=1
MRFNADTFARGRDAEWFAQVTATLPARWIDTIRREWSGAWSPFEEMRRAANLDVCRAVAGLTDAQRAGLRPDASDVEIKQRAQVFARHYQDGINGRVGQGMEMAAVAWAAHNMERHGLIDFWPSKKGRTFEQEMARLKCVKFWRRVLRGVFAKTVEACSIGLGLVNKDRDCYVSNQSVSRHTQQIISAEKVLEQTYLENEFGQQINIKALAAKGAANKDIRLAELMTRISGMDMIAQDMGHQGIFITVTCPSRMHKWTQTATGAVRPNPKYDGTTPRDAQTYLCKQWNKLGAALGRAGVERYGFRVVEPHHDGCPHWHLLLFYKPITAKGKAARAVMRDAFKRYFLDNDSATERGAAERRITYKPIDRTKGSAAGYIAKYISKNTTGFQLEFDLYGNPIVSTVQRVAAWASTWRVRQFQQIGGAPVGVWRELRRINPEAVEGVPLPDELREAMNGVNIGQQGGKLAVGYQTYTMAQGGPCVARKALRIRLLKQESGEVGSYGEVKAADVIGVQAAGRNLYKPQHMVDMLGKLAPTVARPAFAALETERCQWRHVTKAQVKPEAERSIKGIQANGEAVRPWTRVNNSTRLQVWDRESIRDQVAVTRSKTGNFRGWMGKTEVIEGEPSSKTN